MSKVVVVLQPSGLPVYLTVDDKETTITWSLDRTPGGSDEVTLPIETYYCEGEAFHFARYEHSPECTLDTATYLIA